MRMCAVRLSDAWRRPWYTGLVAGRPSTWQKVLQRGPLVQSNFGVRRCVCNERGATRAHARYGSNLSVGCSKLRLHVDGKKVQCDCCRLACSCWLMRHCSIGRSWHRMAERRREVGGKLSATCFAGLCHLSGPFGRRRQ